MIRIKVPFSLEDYDCLDMLDNLPVELTNWISSVANANVELYKNKTSAIHSEYVNSNKRLWGDADLKEWMLSVSKDKCWYTEVKCGAEYLEIEHFRPKGAVKDENSNVISNGYYWLAFNLTNYRLSKPMPNRKKGSFFPILHERSRAKSNTDCHLDEFPWFLDPLSPRDPLLLSFNDNGKAVPEIGNSVIQNKRVVFTITHLGLNHKLLNRRRKEVWLATRQLFYRYSRLTYQAEQSGSVRVEAKAEEVLVEIINRVKPSAEFSSVAKAALKRTGNQMALSIAMSA